MLVGGLNFNTKSPVKIDEHHQSQMEFKQTCYKESVTHVQEG